MYRSSQMSLAIAYIASYGVVHFCSGLEVPNLAYNMSTWGSKAGSFPKITDGDCETSHIFGVLNKWNFVAVDLGSTKALGLVRIKLMTTVKREDGSASYAIHEYFYIVLNHSSNFCELGTSDKFIFCIWWHPGYLHRHICLLCMVSISATQYTLGVSNSRMMNINAIAHANMSYKVTSVASTDAPSYDIPIPRGHSVRYIYVYLMEVRYEKEPRLRVMEIEAYAAFSSGK